MQQQLNPSRTGGSATLAAVAGSEGLEHQAGSHSLETPSNHALGAGLKQRHVVMLSIGGCIGAGLFVGSGHAIAEAGPASVLAYLFASLLVVLVMRMLGEMACAMPDSGSFSTYADKAIGPWAGFTIGWMYWWFWVLVVPMEATAAASILNSWFPSVPVWEFCLGVTLLMTGANLVSVKHYGELEFWFAIIKVAAIIAFIGCGVVALSGLLPKVQTAPVENILGHGGFMPRGFLPVVGALLTTMSTFLGTEIVTIAASESANPARQISRAIKSVIWRISFFYIGSIAVIICVIPWNNPALVQIGSYQSVLEAFHVPFAKPIMDMLILTAVGSCLNSSLYTCSRMLFSLGKRKQAPALVTNTNAAGVPVNAVLASTIVAFAGVAANYLAPKYVFDALLSTTGMIALLVYFVIAVCQVRLRRHLTAAQLRVKMWFHPFLALAVIVMIAAACVVMLYSPDHRQEVIATLGSSLALAVVGYWRQRRAALALH